MCLYVNQKTHVVCDLSFVVRSKGVLTVSYVHFRSGIISELLLDRCCNNRSLSGSDMRHIY